MRNNNYFVYPCIVYKSCIKAIYHPLIDSHSIRDRFQNSSKILCIPANKSMLKGGKRDSREASTDIAHVFIINVKHNFEVYDEAFFGEGP